MGDAIAQFIAQVKPGKQRVAVLELGPVTGLLLSMTGQDVEEDRTPIHSLVVEVCLQMSSFHW